MEAKIIVKETGEELEFAPSSLVCGLRNGEEVEFAIDEVEVLPKNMAKVVNTLPSLLGRIIDWETTREKAAISVFPLLLQTEDYKTAASLSVEYADELIAQLKKDGLY